jgi:Rrf2 family protein
MAVHVLLVLAYKEGDPVTSQYLAESINTNPVIVRKLLLALQKARLVDTRKGAGHGSRLNKAPGKINLGEVYQAVEGQQPFAMPSRKPNEGCPVGQCIAASLEQVFATAEGALVEDLSRTTLAGLLKVVQAKCLSPV